MSGMVIVARAFNAPEARIIVATLADAGILANALWVETLSNSWFEMLALGGIAIEVPEEDRDAAIALLCAVEQEVPRSGVPLWLTPFLVALLLAIGFPLPLRLRAELPATGQLA